MPLGDDKHELIYKGLVHILGSHYVEAKGKKET